MVTPDNKFIALFIQMHDSNFKVQDKKSNGFNGFDQQIKKIKDALQGATNNMCKDCYYVAGNSTNLRRHSKTCPILHKPK